MNDMQTITGTVWAVFGHRFAIDGKEGRILADLGPKGAEVIAIAHGDTVTITGEPKSSEIKVTLITLKDGTVCEIAWPRKLHTEKANQTPADPAAVLAAVKAEGYAVEGEPQRKPKHFEIVGAKDGIRHEIHVELYGKIRTAKPLAA